MFCRKRVAESVRSPASWRRTRNGPRHRPHKHKVPTMPRVTVARQFSRRRDGGAQRLPRTSSTGALPQFLPHEPQRGAADTAAGVPVGQAGKAHLRGSERRPQRNTSSSPGAPNSTAATHCRTEDVARRTSRQDRVNRIALRLPRRMAHCARAWHPDGASNVRTASHRHGGGTECPRRVSPSVTSSGQPG